MDDMHLPFRLRWAGESLPDLTGFSVPLAIPFWLKPTIPESPPTQPVGAPAAHQPMASQPAITWPR